MRLTKWQIERLETLFLGLFLGMLLGAICTITHSSILLWGIVILLCMFGFGLSTFASLEADR